MKIIRQGDVMLVAVKDIPKGAIDITPKKGRVVLAFGEVTGHAHAIADITKVRLWEAGAERFLQVLFEAELNHEEHSTAYLKPGIYRMPIQMEYQPKALIRVTD